MMKFSIIMPCYNGGKYLEHAINSVLNQDYRNWELLIVDGKSTDNSHEIIRKYCELDSRIKWHKYKDNGISDAFNYALNFAQGDLIGHQGSDDYYNAGTFRKISDFLDKRKDYSWIYGNAYNVYPTKNLKILVKPGYFSYNALFLGCFIGQQTTFIKKEVMMLYKLDEDNKYSMDYDLWLRLYKTHRPLYIPEVLSYNVQDGNISTGSRAPLQRIEVDKVAKKYARTRWQKLLVSVRHYRLPILGWKLFSIYKIFRSYAGNRWLY